MISLRELEQTCLNEVLTISEVAKQLAVSRKRVRDLCVAGKLIARQSGTIWLISQTSVNERKALK